MKASGNDAGIVSAVMTPASVACIPDLSTQTHITRPVSTYAAVLVTPARFIAISTMTAATVILLMDYSSNGEHAEVRVCSEQ